MFKKFKSLYFIGIGGISMSALARIFQAKGVKIYGIDANYSQNLDNLMEEGMIIRTGEQAPTLVRACDAVVYTSAISENNEDILLAKKLNKPIFSRAEVLGYLSKQKKTISIAGSHGKTTTTGMIANCLIKAQRDPTIHIGGILNNINSNVQIGKSDFFITEACEYKDSFLSLKNFISIVLNVEEDHLDYFKNLDNIYNSFNKFIKNTSKNGMVIYNFDENSQKLKLPRNSLSFGYNDGADVQAKNLKMKNGKYSFNLFYLGKKLGRLNLSCYGKHNILNALACSAACIFLGLSFKQLKLGLQSFTGIQRRFQIISDKKALTFHDYAHHPKEIESTLRTCREINKKNKLITIFQPHTFTRTRDLYGEFLHCFDLCDEVWLLPIYPAREEPIENISSYNLCQDLIKLGKNCKYFQHFDDCQIAIKEIDKKGNIISILGAGDIVELVNNLK